MLGGYNLTTSAIFKLLFYVIGALAFYTIGCKKKVDNTSVSIQPDPYEREDSVVVTDAVLKNGGHIYVIKPDGQGAVSFTGVNKLLIKDLNAIQNGRLQPGGRLTTDSIKVGDFLVSSDGLGTPGGLLGRVTAVASSGAGIVIDFISAQLEDIFDSLHVHWHFSNKDKDKDSLKNKAFNRDYEIENGIKLTLNGEYTIKKLYEITIAIKGGILDTAKFNVAGAVEATLNAGLAYPQVLFDRTDTLFLLKPFTKSTTISVAGIKIPVVVTITDGVYLNTHADGRFEIAGQLLKSSHSVNVLFDYTKDNGVLFNANGSSNIQPSNDGQLKSKLLGHFNLSLSNDLKASFYKTTSVGLSAGLGIYLNLTGACNADSLQVSAIAGAQARLSGEINLFKVLPIHNDFLKIVKEEPLYKRNFPPGDWCSIHKDSSKTRIGSSGDPHNTTADGAYWDCQPIGEFIQLQSSYNNLLVQARQSKQPNRMPNVSLNTAIGVREGADIIFFQAVPLALYHNHVRKDMNSPLLLEGGGTVTFKTGSIYIDFATGDKVRINYYNQGYLDYTVDLIQKHYGKIRGLLGDWNGIRGDDLKTSDGHLINPHSFADLYPGFVDSWRITQDSSLFEYEGGKNTLSFTDRTYPLQPFTISPDQFNIAQNACLLAGVTDQPALANCIYDHVAANSDDFTQSSLQNQLDFPSDGLIVNMPFDGNAKDLSGFGNDGLLSGEVTFSTDRKGQAGSAALFNLNGLGGQGYISITNTPSIMGLNKKITVVCWVLVNSYDNVFAAILCKNFSSNVHALQLQLSTNTICSDAFTGSALATLTKGTWNHISLVVDGDIRRYYVNGINVGDKTISQIETNANTLDIGRDLHGNVQFFRGKIDDLKIYNRVLSDDDVKALYTK
jgi:hypothetical protein